VIASGWLGQLMSAEGFGVGVPEQKLAVVLVGAFADEEVSSGCVGVLEGMTEPAVTGWQQNTDN